MDFSKQECWIGLPFPSPGDLPDPGIKAKSPALQADSLPPEPPGKPFKVTWVPIFVILHNCDQRPPRRPQGAQVPVLTAGWTMANESPCCDTGGAGPRQPHRTPTVEFLQPGQPQAPRDGSCPLADTIWQRPPPCFTKAAERSALVTGKQKDPRAGPCPGLCPALSSPRPRACSE